LGGIGKTRLALALAERVQDRFPDGGHFVPLQPLQSPDQIIACIITTLGIPADQKPHEQLLAWLRDKHLLLVLDNFEHLLDGVSLVDRILSEAPGVTLLATSREPLKLSWEWIFPVQGLTIAAPDCPEDCDALRLFVARARQRLPGFMLDSHRPAVTRICQLVEGMPLAIELAAAWAGTLAVETIAHELAGSLDLLETEAHDVPDRHRSIRAAFDPTWQRLSGTEQEVFARLSVFRGGFTREAAREVAGASLRTLMALVEKSLVRFDVSTGRYAIHECVRQYGDAQLHRWQSTSEVWQRHLSYFTGMANHFRSLQNAKESYENIAVLNPMESEIDNFRAALDRAFNLEEYEQYLRLLDALNWFLVRRNHFQEAQRWNEQALCYLQLAPLDMQGRLLRRAGDVAYRRGDYTEALQRYEAASRAFQAIGDQGSAARLKTSMGRSLTAVGHFQQAADIIGEALHFHQANGNLELQYETLHALGVLALSQGNYQEAGHYFELCQEISQEFSLRSFEALITLDLALVARLEGDFDRAQKLLGVTLPILYEVDYRKALAECIMGTAVILSHHGYVNASVRLAAAVSTLDIALGGPQHDIKSDIYQRELAKIRTQLDPEAFEHLWGTGATLSRHEAVALAQTALADLGPGEGQTRD
jgi:predicted ATPase